MKRIVAIVVLSLLYLISWFVAVFVRVIRWRGLSKKRAHKRIIVNGTFHNPNWFRAHITPLVESQYGEVILVCDEPIDDLPNLTYSCPPEWARRLLSRAGAKALWTLFEGIRRPADIFVGYHIFPSAVTVLVCARILGAKAVYQITSGPLELEGGGWHAENVILTALGKPSRLIERLAFAVVREFDLAVVRGTSAAEFVRRHGFANKIEVVTGSVRTNAPMAPVKDIDVIFVGRLTEYKRPDRLLDVVSYVVGELPESRFVIVGDGPDRSALELRARAEGIEKNIEFLGQRSDVLPLMSRAKTFVLTSRWEGVSIAMLEAMAMKAVPVVTRVGDLADFAIDDQTGFVVDEGEQEKQANYIISLLSDDRKLVRMADSARELVVNKCDSEVLASRWKRIFISLVAEG